MDGDSVTELPCRFYSYPIKHKGICLVLKWTVKNFFGISAGSAHRFPHVRPTPQCDLEVSFVKIESLCLYVENKCESDIRFDATTIIFDIDGKLLYSEAVKNVWLRTKPNILPAMKNRNRLTGSMVFEIKLHLYKSDGDIWNMSAWKRGRKRKLEEDMKNSILAELPAEVVLETKDGVEIRANRAILRARSSVFRKMFDHTLTELNSGVVPIQDVCGDTMRSLVQFLYSGKAGVLYETSLESLEELYYAADKYEVLDLREICGQTMIPLLTKENALRVLVMAHRHSDEDLKKECLCFISSSSCIEAIMDTQDWENLKDSVPVLAFQVLETCVKGSNNGKQ